MQNGDIGVAYSYLKMLSWLDLKQLEFVFPLWVFVAMQISILTPVLKWVG